MNDQKKYHPEESGSQNSKPQKMRIKRRLVFAVVAVVVVLVGIAAAWYVFTASEETPATSSTSEQTVDTSENIPEAPYKKEVLELADELKPGVVEIMTDISSGSGYILHKDGYILTNRHVVKDSKNIEIKTISGSTHPVRIVGKSKKTDVDLALLKAKKPLVDTTTLSLGSNAKLKDGDVVFSIAHPGSYGKWAVTAGKYIKTPDKEKAQGQVWIDKPGSQGESGGPVLNMDGQIVGTVFGAESDPDKKRLQKDAEVVVHWGNAENHWTDITTAVDITSMKTFLKKHLDKQLVGEMSR